MMGVAAVLAKSESADTYLELIPFRSLEEFESKLRTYTMAHDTISSFTTEVITADVYTPNPRLKQHIDIITEEVLHLV